MKLVTNKNNEYWWIIILLYLDGFWWNKKQIPKIWRDRKCTFLIKNCFLYATFVVLVNQNNFLWHRYISLQILRMFWYKKKSLFKIWIYIYNNNVIYLFRTKLWIIIFIISHIFFLIIVYSINENTLPSWY